MPTSMTQQLYTPRAPEEAQDMVETVEQAATEDKPKVVMRVGGRSLAGCCVRTIGEGQDGAAMSASIWRMEARTLS